MSGAERRGLTSVEREQFARRPYVQFGEKDAVFANGTTVVHALRDDSRRDGYRLERDHDCAACDDARVVRREVEAAAEDFE